MTTETENRTCGTCGSWDSKDQKFGFCGMFEDKHGGSFRLQLDNKCQYWIKKIIPKKREPLISDETTWFE